MLKTLSGQLFRL